MSHESKKVKGESSSPFHHLHTVGTFLARGEAEPLPLINRFPVCHACCSTVVGINFKMASLADRWQFKVLVAVLTVVFGFAAVLRVIFWVVTNPLSWYKKKDRSGE